MGLDQYLFKTKQSQAEVESGNFDSEETKSISYWRKHPNLQGYMESIWKERTFKPTTDEDGYSTFNCEKVFLSLEDLDNWEKIVKEKKYPKTRGFFFGYDSDKEEYEHDLKAIKEAREAIKEGYTIYYDSWW